MKYLKQLQNNILQRPIIKKNRQLSGKWVGNGL